MGVAKRRKVGQRGTLAGSLLDVVSAVVAAHEGKRWPLVQYQGDPVAFVREVLGAEHVLPKQREFLESVRDNVKTALRSGTKTGKTKTLIWAALWFYCCFPSSRVIMLATLEKQLRTVLWKELRNTLRTSKTLIDGKWSDNPATGFRAEDGREIFAGGARDIEGLAGQSGGAQFFIVDEASHLPQSKYEAILGNMSGHGVQRFAAAGNPVRAEGPFYEWFHGQREHWATFALSSVEVAEWQAARNLAIPGLARLGTLEAWKEEWGEDSPFYVIRVRGEFLLNETGHVISMEKILQAQERWNDAADVGPLSIGLDPAGPGIAGDESVFAIVRGKKCLALFAFRGLTDDGHLTHLRSLITTYRRGDEPVSVTVDSEGPIGGKLFAKLRAVAENLRTVKPAEAFSVFGVKASDKARRWPQHYDRVRDELAANLAAWLPRRGTDGLWEDEGGAIPMDHKLAQELYAPVWIGMPNKPLGGLKVSSKDDQRDVLGRSPDRADALALAVWRPSGPSVGEVVPVPVAPPRDAQEAAWAFDQQAGADHWWPSGNTRGLLEDSSNAAAQGSGGGVGLRRGLSVVVGGRRDDDSGRLGDSEACEEFFDVQRDDLVRRGAGGKLGALDRLDETLDCVAEGDERGRLDLAVFRRAHVGFDPGGVSEGVDTPAAADEGRKDLRVDRVVPSVGRRADKVCLHYPENVHIGKAGGALEHYATAA